MYDRYEYEGGFSMESAPKEIKELFADMEAHNKEWPSLARKVVNLKTWASGLPDGFTTDEYYRIIIYERVTDLFYLYQFHYYWEFDLTKLHKEFITLSRDEVMTFVGEALAMKDKKQEVA